MSYTKLIGTVLLLGCTVVLPLQRCKAADTSLPRIITHDNRLSAGTLKDGTLTIQLEIRKGTWYPEAEDGPSIDVYAFAEAGKAPMIPGPLLRVAEGTRIEATVRNVLQEPMVLHGFMSRPGEDVPVAIGPGEEKHFTFDAGKAGTYFYWAGTPRATLAVGSVRYSDETQLSGGFMVDGPDARPDERVFVIGLWKDYEDREDPSPAGLKEFAVINGKSWPHTERLKFRMGDDVIWHWINSSATIHPMHMHGSYFQVLSRGDWQRDTPLKPEMRPYVVTDLMQPGKTFSMRWQPTEPGYWLFHCHLMAHLEPKHSLSALQNRLHGHEMHSGMVGLVLALDVEGKRKPVKAAYKQRRKLTLVIEPVASNPIQVRMQLREGKRRTDSTNLLGPLILLRRGEPTDITVVNNLPQPTAIHWHGMELESYYDGVPDFTGMGKRMTPKIPPGAKFVARMTPPRAGTFIYHTHWHDIEQLRGGLNGALVVTDETYDPSADQIFLSAFGPNDQAPLLLNGSGTPAALQWTPGKTYRVRFVNIGPNVPIRFSLLSGSETMTWKAVAKDGMELPEAQRTKGSASQLIAVGETYDFEVKAPASGEMTVRAFIAANRGVTPERKVEQAIRLREMGESVATGRQR